MARCEGSEDTRPVLADQANLARRYERRLPLYRTAHVSIPSDAPLVARLTTEPRPTDAVTAMKTSDCDRKLSF